MNSALHESCANRGAFGRRVVVVAVFGAAVLLASCSHDLAAPKSASVTAVRKTAAGRAVRPKAEVAGAASAKSRVYEVRLQSTSEVAAYGRGPYICSPSGFGRVSHCVRRAGFN